jgi:tRNA pseudouridine55 synthase
LAEDVHGILLLDKPLRLSSAGAVARAKWLFAARKAGHTGSLDPLATGMLPICFGEATKFGAQLLEADKSYRVSVRLGERTASADRESPVIETRELAPYTLSQLETALESFPRRYEQTPPMHSAIKQEGKPLYEYARAGIIRERAARTVTLHELRLLAWQAPELSFDVRCTKGAYIRVLAEDLAAHLGTVGHLSALRRLSVVPFATEPQFSLEALERMGPEQRRETLLPVDAALKGWPRFDLPEGGVDTIRQGQILALQTEGAGEATGTVRMYAAGLGFVGLGEIKPPGLLRPMRLISAHANRA